MAFIVRMMLIIQCLVFSIASILLGFRFPPVGWGLFLLLAVKRFRGHQRASTSHGSARLADGLDILQQGLLREDGLILGTNLYADPPSKRDALRAIFSPRIRSVTACRLFLSAWLGPRWSGESILRVNSFVHLAAFAPTGKGKGVSLLIPNLLSYRHSCIVTDPKGELYSETADHRRRNFRHRTVRFDPYHLCGPGSDRLNPLDFIDDQASDFPEQCRDLACAFVIRTGAAEESHWCDSAEIVLTAFIAYVCACEKDRSKRHLQTVRDLVASRDAYLEAMEVMTTITSHGGAVARLGKLLSWYVDRELGSILSTVQRFTSFLDSPAIAAITCGSTFHPAELRSGRVTVYLVLPPERLSSIPGLMRMWLTTLLRTLTKTGADESRPVLCLLDECAHLGNVPVLEDAVTLMRGYGVRLWMFFQSASQMKKCFGERSPTILDNIGVQIYFGTAAYESAEAISKRVGDLTMLVSSVNRSVSHSTPTGGDGRQSGSVSHSRSTNTNEHGRAIFRPDEVLRLPGSMALVFIDNRPALPVRLLRYYSAPEFANGGIGKSRGLGLGSAMVATAGMAVSAALLVFAIALSRVPMQYIQLPSGGFDAASAEGDAPDYLEPMQPLRRQRRTVYYPPINYGDSFNPWLPETW